MPINNRNLWTGDKHQRVTESQNIFKLYRNIQYSPNQLLKSTRVVNCVFAIILLHVYDFNNYLFNNMLL